MTTTPLIEVRNLCFSYQFGKKALTNVQMTIPRGARVAFIGSNGAGKSTLFLHLNAILKPQAGNLFYDGQIYEYSRSFVALLRQKVGLVFQDPDIQLFAGNVFDDVLFGPMNLGLPPDVARRQAEKALTAVQMLEYGDKPAHFLSHGQKKRVAIAGVLAMEPEVLVMDEPTAGLDYPGILNLNEIMAILYAQGKTLVVATHDINWAWGWADLVYVLAEGQVVASGAPGDILNRSDHTQLGYDRPILGEMCAELEKNHLILPGQQRLPRSAGELVNLLLAGEG